MPFCMNIWRLVSSFSKVRIIRVCIYYPVSRALLLRVWLVGQQCCLIRKLVRNVEARPQPGLLAWNLQFNVTSGDCVTVMCDEPRLNAVFLVKHSSVLTISNAVLNTCLTVVFLEASILHLSWLSWQRAFSAFSWLVLHNSLPFSGLVGKGFTRFERF